MVPDKNINDFVNRLRATGEVNLVSIILYGSAAAGRLRDWPVRCESAVRLRDPRLHFCKLWLRRWRGGGDRSIACRS